MLNLAKLSILALGLGVGLGAVALPTTSAEAQDAKIKKFSFDVAPLYKQQFVVTSKFGDKWDTIESGTVKIRAHGVLDTKRRGKIIVAGLYLGDCTSNLCPQRPTIWSEAVLKNRWYFDFAASISSSKLHFSKPGAITPFPMGDEILRACNSHLTAYGASRDVTFTHPFRITFSADTHKTKLIGKHFYGSEDLDEHFNGDVNRTREVRIPIVCKANKLKTEKPAPYAVATSIVQDGDRCPRQVKMITDVFYLRPGGEASIRTLHNSGNVVEQTKKATGKAPNTPYYRARFTRMIVAKKGKHTFESRVKGGLNAPIKKLKVTCPEFNIDLTTLKYETYNNKVCPRKVRETATFYTNGPGVFRYQIKNMQGAVLHQKKIKARWQNGRYMAVAVRNFRMNAYEGDRIAQLKSDSGVNSGWTKLKVACDAKNNNQISTGNTGAQNNQATQTPKPKVKVAVPTKPKVKVAAPVKPRVKKPKIKKPKTQRPKAAKLFCKGGKQRGKRCVCTKRAKLKKIGNRRFACVAPVMKAKLICVNGRKKANRCVCPRSAKMVKRGARKFQCVQIKKRVKAKAKVRKQRKAKRCGKRKVLVRGKCITRAS